MSSTYSYFQVYVLRFWAEEDPEPGDALRWRFMLVDPETGARRGFPSLEALTFFLQEQIEPTNAGDLPKVNSSLDFSFKQKDSE